MKIFVASILLFEPFIIKFNISFLNIIWLLIVDFYYWFQNLLSAYIQLFTFKIQLKKFFLIGPHLKKDIKYEEKGGWYSESLLYKVQFKISNDSILVLKYFENIYPSLYDLFSQNTL